MIAAKTVRSAAVLILNFSIPMSPFFSIRWRKSSMLSPYVSATAMPAGMKAI